MLLPLHLTIKGNTGYNWQKYLKYEREIRERQLSHKIVSIFKKFSIFTKFFMYLLQIDYRMNM